MKLNVQLELQRFKYWQTNAPPVVDPDLLQLLGVITGYFRTLTTGDWRVTQALCKIGSQLIAEVKRLMVQPTPAQATGQGLTKKDNVLYAVYDRIENLLIVAKANQNELEIEIYQKLFAYLQDIYAQELKWLRIESLGRTYNPYEYDGFVADRSRIEQADQLTELVIVNELRPGFICEGEVIRKPVVEFFEGR